MRAIAIPAMPTVSPAMPKAISRIDVSFWVTVMDVRSIVEVGDGIKGVKLSGALVNAAVGIDDAMMRGEGGMFKREK